MLATPRNEFPEFPAALSFVFGLTADEATAAFERRARRLRQSVAALDHELQDESGPPRLFLLETEYIRAVTAAELEWVEKVVDDIRTGELVWHFDDVTELAKRFTPPDPV
jgi:hypothetical protein